MRDCSEEGFGVYNKLKHWPRCVCVCMCVFLKVKTWVVGRGDMGKGIQTSDVMQPSERDSWYTAIRCSSPPHSAVRTRGLVETSAR